MMAVRLWKLGEGVTNYPVDPSMVEATPADLLDALGFPSDEDVETAAKAVYTRRWGPSMSGPRPGAQDYDIARAALEAGIESHRTKEEERDGD